MRVLITLGLLACAVSAARDASPRLVTTPIQFADHFPSDAKPERLSGYFKLNRTYDARLFFFYFESRESPETAPVVLWMSGGPGCSSEIAVFAENGPWTINADYSLNETRFGWDRKHNLVYVDQPVGTGFSYSSDDRDRCYDERCVSDDMLDFLVEFMKARPELADRDVFITGESYAGHYVPAVSSRILHATESGELARPIKLRGMAIGNGLVDPAIQYGAYAPYAYQEGLISKGLRDRILMLYPACRVALEVCDGINWSVECKLAVAFCQATQFGPVMAAIPGTNVYDYRKECVGPLCYDFSRMEKYLNLPSVRKALGVGERRFELCSPSVHEDMMGDWGHNFDVVIPELLKAGVRVMVYAGNKDIICNIEGNRRWVDALPWEGSAKWAAAKAEIWEVGGARAGSIREAENLSFWEVFDAGHMVPMDQPEAGLDMITRFTRGKPLAGGEGAPSKLEEGGPGITGRPYLREQ